MSFDYNAENIFHINLYLILQELQIITKEKDFCTCEICLDDICALTLIQLPPAYATNLLDRDEAIRRIDKENVLNDSINKFTSNPHH